MTDRLRHFYRPGDGCVEVVFYTPDGSRLCRVEQLTPEQAWAHFTQLSQAIADPRVGLIPRSD